MAKLYGNVIVGLNESRQLIRYLTNPNDYEIQREGLNFYLDKFASLNLGLETSFKINYNEAYQNIRSYIIRNFEETHRLNFSLLVLGCYIMELLNAQWTVSFSNDFNAELRLASTRKYESFLNNAKDYENFVPFFGKACTYGYKVFLDLILNYNLFPIGFGTQCYPVHNGAFKNSFDISYHDMNHNYIVQENITKLGLERLRNLYSRISYLPIFQRGRCMYLLFVIIHEFGVKL